MPSLLELQRDFSSALRFGEIEEIAPYVVANGIDPAARLRIYRNNTRENLLSTLRATYPVLERLTGADYFRQLAFDYLERFPSTSGDLQYAGERLATYLERRYAASEYAYFTDVARLEWAYQAALIAAEHSPLDPTRLQGIAAGRYADLRFELHPAVRLVESAYPVLTIWSANQSDVAMDQTIDLRQGGERVLLQRSAAAIEFARISQPEFELLSAIAAGKSLLETAEAASNCADADFDLGRSLRRYVGSGVIVDFHCSSPTPTGD